MCLIPPPPPKNFLIRHCVCVCFVRIVYAQLLLKRGVGDCCTARGSYTSTFPPRRRRDTVLVLAEIILRPLSVRSPASSVYEPLNTHRIMSKVNNLCRRYNNNNNNIIITSPSVCCVSFHFSIVPISTRFPLTTTTARHDRQDDHRPRHHQHHHYHRHTSASGPENRVRGEKKSIS